MHQERVAKMRNISFEKQMEEYEPGSGMPPLVGEEPRQLQYLFELWSALSVTKNADNPINYLDIQAYCTLNRLTFEAWEIELIISIDRAWTAQYAKERDRDNAPSSST